MSDLDSNDTKDDDKDEDEFEDYPPIIIDNGSGLIKCGFSSLTNDYPESIFESIVGHSKIKDASEYSSFYVGEEAINKRRTKKLSLKRPINTGTINNWDDITILWKYIFEKELKCLEDVEDSTIVLSETPLNPRFNREKTIQIMFETFNVASYYTQNTAVFELYSHGQTTGMVIGCGFDSCYTVPIYQGYALAHATNRMDFGSNQVNIQLLKLLHTAGTGFNLDNMENKFDAIEELKKKKCYVSTDYWVEMKNKNTSIWKNQNVVKYTLPDGHDVMLGSNRFESTEIFFKPQLVGGHHANNKSICQYAYDSLLSVNIDVRKEIASNICIAGGGTLLNGFVERFTKDIKNIVPASMKLKIQCKPNRYNATYIGASILSTLDFFRELIVTSEEYEESGPKIVNRKCF